jgi:hypothetical protein
VLVKDFSPGIIARLPNCRFVDVSGVKLPEESGPLDMGKNCRLLVVKGLSKERIPTGKITVIT